MHYYVGINTLGVYKQERDHGMSIAARCVKLTYRAQEIHEMGSGRTAKRGHARRISTQIAPWLLHQRGSNPVGTGLSNECY